MGKKIYYFFRRRFDLVAFKVEESMLANFLFDLIGIDLIYIPSSSGRMMDLNVLLPEPFGPANIRRRRISLFIEFLASDRELLALGGVEF
jgi:hypothetical protein